jgi:hypothetical protein
MYRQALLPGNMNFTVGRDLIDHQYDSCDMGIKGLKKISYFPSQLTLSGVFHSFIHSL